MDFTGKTVEFKGPEIQPAGDEWVLLSEYSVCVGTSHKLVCPRGMLTDGASIPRFFWRLIGHPMKLPAVKAAVIHDGAYLGKLVWYRKNPDLWGHSDQQWVEEDFTRKEADELFRELLRVLGVSWWRRQAMYTAVRWFGGSRWTERA